MIEIGNNYFNPRHVAAVSGVFGGVNGGKAAFSVWIVGVEDPWKPNFDTIEQADAARLALIQAVTMAR